MTDLSSKTALVFDHGLFLPVAFRLAEDFGKVYYHTPWEEGFPSIKKGILGDGHSEVIRCDHPLDLHDEVDCWVFPDLLHSDLQVHLEEGGHRVWGSRRADSIELNREKFLKILEAEGLDVADHEVIEGITNLREYLQDKKDCYIKISRWRGDLETTHWRNWELDKGLLDVWGLEFGPTKDLIRFLVFPAIETDLEIGGDTYCVGGQWPNLLLNGLEYKDESYFAAVTERSEMPEQVQAVLEAFGPVLGNYGYANEFSCEIRVQGDKAYFIDPTCRGGLPSTGSQLCLWKNYSEIVWAGSEGELVEPEPAAKFSAECALTVKSEKGAWSIVELPAELKPWAKMSACGEVDGRFIIPPNELLDGIVGWLVAIGDTPEETIQKLIDLAGKVPEGVLAHTQKLADVIKEVESAEDQGVPITPEPMPEPSIVLQ